MKIKITTGFRADQYHTIDIEESHKAYYLFTHPDERGVFKNGVALLGSDIRSIVPDYHATMGWNPTHVLDNDDWTEIRGREIDIKIRELLSQAKKLSELPNPHMNILLSEAINFLPEPSPFSPEVKALSDKFKIT